MIVVTPVSIVNILFFIAACNTVAAQKPTKHNTYATILQDSRYEPTPDGTFRYLYKTEDGIVSSAQGDPSGVIHGTFSYTDPTGLRVNYNYNAGTRRAQAPAEEEEQDAPPVRQAPVARPAPVDRPGPVAPVARPVGSGRKAPPRLPTKYTTVPAKIPAPKPAARLRPAQPIYTEEPDYYSQPSEDQYVEVEYPYYRPRTRPSHRQVYQPRQYRPIARSNHIVDNDYY